MTILQQQLFVVNKSPYCVWTLEGEDQDVRFINSIDPRYFSYLAKVHDDLLGDPETQQYAAIALRTAYSHGLESLFALICALVQAPDSILGWLLKYSNTDLFELAEKINKKEEVYTKLPIKSVSWKSIVATITPFSEDDPERQARIHNSITKLWQHFADDYLKESFKDEYNSIKHGWRIKLGGTKLAFGLETTPGVPAPAENMRLMSDSVFGSTYFKANRLSDRFNLRITQHAINWNPEKYSYALQLITMSMNNIVSYLRLVHGFKPEDAPFLYPLEETDFDLPWKQKTHGFSSFSMNNIIDASQIKRACSIIRGSLADTSESGYTLAYPNAAERRTYRCLTTSSLSRSPTRSCGR